MIGRKILFGLAFMLSVTPINLTVASQSTFDHEHTLLTEVLDKHVTAGLVNYRALKVDPGNLDEYLQNLAEIDPELYENWTRQQKLALWINAYNAFTIRVVLDHYPIEHSWLADPLGQYPDNSIRQIRGVWDDMTWPIMGKNYTLNHIEHVILRRDMLDPRIHFVLVCASMGCPRLETKAFGAADLDARLHQAGIDYIYDSHRVKINQDRKLVLLPQIFHWFPEDFESGTKYMELFKDHPSGLDGILSWVYQYANYDDRKFLQQDSYETSYSYYNWALNEKK